MKVPMSEGDSTSGNAASTGSPFLVLFIGDVVGGPGRKIVGQALPRIIPRWGIGLVVCNAENAAGGSGLTVGCHEELVEAGVDVMTMGDHVYRKDEIFQVFDRTGTVLRPANFPPDSPGPFLAVVHSPGRHHGRGLHRHRPHVHEAGRLPVPRGRPPDRADRGNAKVVVVDVHAEATSEKQLLARYLDGRVSAVLGTHTHVATADEQILEQGTAYQTDVGMTGPHDSILGRRYDRVLSSTLSRVPAHFDVATGDPRLNGALVTHRSGRRGKALAISRVSLNQEDVRRFLTDSATARNKP